MYGQLRPDVKEQNANHYSEKQHTVKHNTLTTTKSQSLSYLHLDQSTFDFMEICCEIIMDLSSMIDL